MIERKNTWSKSHKPEQILSKFLDLDKNKECFYNNFYLDDLKLVIKMPFFKEEKCQEEIKIEKFNPADYIFLLSYK